MPKLDELLRENGRREPSRSLGPEGRPAKLSAQPGRAGYQWMMIPPAPACRGSAVGAAPFASCYDPHSEGTAERFELCPGPRLGQPSAVPVGTAPIRSSRLRTYVLG